MTILTIDVSARKSQAQMNNIRKWRHKREDQRITEELSNLLRRYGDQVLLGKTTLCLTTQVLVSLNRQFNELTDGTSYQSFQVADHVIKGHKQAFIFEFMQKAPQIKLTSGPVCSPSPFLNLGYFKNVSSLEIKRVPVCYIKGLHFLRRNIKTLICSRSTNDIKGVVYQFGKEGTSLFALNELQTLDLSYNTIRCVDESVTLLPALKSLNLSHNCLVIVNLENMPPVSYLNLGFNSISQIPQCPDHLASHITTLVLRNNNLSSLAGIDSFRHLKCLDVSGNCIASFDDLSPLAQLQFLVNVNLQGNPLEFMQDYRANTIARLCPVMRREPVYLDGKVLTNIEELYLGKYVEPVSLSAYIPSEPIGRPRGSLKGLANSLYALSKDGPMESTPILRGPVTPISKRRNRKIREAHIIDARTKDFDESEDTTSSPSQEQRLLLSQGSISSRRSSIDESVIWVHKQGNTEREGRIPDLEYASFDDSCSLTNGSFDVGENILNSTEVNKVEAHTKSLSTLTLNNYDGEKLDERRSSPSVSSDKSSSRCSNTGLGIYSSVPVRLNSLSSLDVQSIDSIDAISDEEDEMFYLVQSVVLNAKDRYGREEKESIFLVMKEPYLIERDPFHDEVLHRLDLNYLQGMTFHTLDPLRINLRFNLLRQDRKERVYIFEDPDSMQGFIDVLKPVLQRNQEREFEDIIEFQCLKCATVFMKRDHANNCPTCGSDLVVERDTNAILNSENDEGALPIEGKSKNSGLEVQEEPFANDVSRESSIAIIVPLSKGGGRQGGSLPPSLSGQDGQAKISLERPLDRKGTGTQSAPKDYTIHTDTSHSNEIEADNTMYITACTTPRGYSSEGSEGSPLSLLSKSNRGSCISSESEHSIHSEISCPSQNSSTRVETPLQKESTGLSSRKSSTMEESNPKRIGLPENTTKKNIVFDKEEFRKIDHRLMLYLILNVFQDETERVCCVLRSSCVTYGKDEEFESLFIVSSVHAFIIKLANINSDAPDKILQSVAKYKLSQLKNIDYGFFNQSFRVDFIGDMASYKFLIRDSLRCERFLATFFCVIENIESLYGKPEVAEEPNPQTAFNLRSQLFGDLEDTVALGRHLFLQASTYSTPPILKTRKVRMRTHANVFICREFIDWMIARRTVKSKIEGIQLLERLTNSSVIQPVSKDAKVSYDDTLFKFSNVEELTKTSAMSGENITTSDGEESDDLELDFDMSIVHYQLLFAGIDRRDSCMLPRTLVTTKTHIFLADECHQWPLSRLYPPPHNILDQFSKVDVQRITNATRLELYEDTPRVLKIEFIDECSDDGPSECSWVLKCETSRSMDTLCSVIRKSWKEQFTMDIPCDFRPFSRSGLMKDLV